VIVKTICGVVVGVLIGIGCRFFEIPLPGPPAILGAFLAVAMATGYTVTDKVLSASARARVMLDPPPHQSNLEPPRISTEDPSLRGR
jgi:XapX domain-containing protein